MQDSLVEEHLSYPAEADDVEAYVARPKDGQPFPAVIVIHEQHGLTEHIEDCSRRFAREGYLAFAPDLYSLDSVRRSLHIEDIERAQRMRGKGDFEAALADVPAENREAVRRAVEWLGNRDRAAHLSHLLKAVDYLKTRPDVRSNAVGAVGYCMGGGFVSELATAGADIAVGVIYYGRVHRLDLIAQISCPLIGHYGSEDPGPTKQVPEVRAAMQAQGKDYIAYIYDGAQHGFNNDTRANFAPEASRVAWKRTFAFLGQHLKVAVVPVR